MNLEEYLGKFPLTGSDGKRSPRCEALKQALDTRKFEIELYWKRATYFWTFIAVTFTGYGLARRDQPEGFLVFFLSCVGFILSFSWFFVNRGSKYWQENWEHHVDHLEDDIIGPLYKIVLRRRDPKGISEWIGNLFTGPSRHSVSKINQLVSLFIAAMWSVLVIDSSCKLKEWHFTNLAVLTLTIFAALGILCGAKTYPKKHEHYAEPRESHIVENEG